MAGDEDAALLSAYAAGDAAAARRLAARLVPRLHALASRVLADPAEAEDVTQETMLRLWKAAPDWRAEGAQVSTWCWKVALNLCIDRRRRAVRLAYGDPPERPDPAPSAPESLMADERRRALDAAMAELPERQRAALSMKLDLGLSQREIAAALDCGEEAVESLLARGRRKLAERLRPQRAALGLEG